MPAGLLNLGCEAVSDEPVVGFEFLHCLCGFVDESEAGALAATIVCPEAKDGDVLLLCLVKLTELTTELILGDVGAVGVEDVAIRTQLSEHFVAHFHQIAWIVTATYTTI